MSFKEYQERYLEKEEKEKDNEGLVRYGCGVCSFKAFIYGSLKRHVTKIHKGNE